MIIGTNEIKISGLTYSVVNPYIYEEYRKTKDAELFEELVSDLILNKYSDCLETNEFILSLPKRDQRLAIMSLIDKETKGDANLVWAEMKAYVDSRVDKMDHVKDVIRIINKFVKDGAIEKKTHGEVMTPISLVREMLSTLPEEVWSNPNLKWLDPANGAGTFPFVVIYKLMKGLEEWEPDLEKRYKHIIENMIYTCELQSRNVFLWMCGVDPYDEYTTNTYWGSFLDKGFDYHMKNVWSVDKFDIVIGNPPYQSSSEDIRGSKSIYNLFVDKSNYLSRQTLMVTPSRWFSNKNMESFRNDMLSKYGLKILNECENDIFKNAEIKGGVSYFLLENNYKGFINFNGELKKFNSGIIDVNIDKLVKYIPKNSTFLSDFFVSGAYFGIETNDSRLGDDVDNTKCYVSKMNGLTKYIRPTEIPQKPNLNRYKLLIPSASGSKDNIGNLGRFEIASPNEVCSSSFSHFSFDTEQGCISLRSYLNTKFIKFLIKVKKPTQRVKKDVFSLVPVVPFDRIWTDENVFDYFGLSTEDIKFLNKII
jgi:site-specific DNA-methyltransferase (adenine-specific)